MPSVFFYLAIFDALGDIKTQWAKVRSEILKRINRNEGLTHEDRHYLRFVLKIDVSLSSILCRKKIEIPKEMESRYAELRSDVSDMEKLH